VLVATDVIEPTFRTLWLRETRWLRTIRSVNPAGFASLFITFTTPWLLIGALAYALLLAGSGGVPACASTRAVLAALGTSTAGGIIARLALHARSSAGLGAFLRDLPLVPLRDVLLLLQWLAAAFGSHVIWRGVRVPVANPDGQPVVEQRSERPLKPTPGAAPRRARARAAVEMTDGR
jgi:ceramide glucosyltransferase